MQSASCERRRIAAPRLVLLPELFENLYWCQVQRESYFTNAHPVDGHPFLAQFCGVARELGWSCRSASSSGAARPITTVSP